ncbi:hypothetical protein NPIL_383421, partial [Nephila pilipes]
MVNTIQTRSQRKKEAEQNNTSITNEDNQTEIAENIAEDVENVLPLFTRKDGDTINLNKINANEFIEVQHKSEELGPLIYKIEKGKKNENSSLLNQLEKLRIETCTLSEDKDERHVEKQEEEQKTKLLAIRQERVLEKEKDVIGENTSIGESEELGHLTQK